jgi:hypothetical protein
MWQALGGLLPIAVAVAVSSVPITMTILILLSPNRNRAALPFLVGWVVGVAAVIVLSTLFASTLPQQPRRGADPTIAVLWMVIGAALILLGAITLRRGSQSESESTGLQGWLFRVDSFGVLVSFSVAVLLNLRPKGLLLGMAAGLALHATSVDLDEALVLIAIYTLIATSTVVVPIVASLVAPRRVEPKLLAVRNWMSHNGRLLTSLIMFMIGVVILGYGLTQL